MTKILMLVEGQSEEIVVRDILAPRFEVLDIYLQAVLVKTKREKSGRAFKGGIVSYAKVEHDLRALLSDSSASAVTTFLDYYGLPQNFPGLSDRPLGDPRKRVAHVEEAFAAQIDHKRFIPHLTLHELEAWIYVDPAAASWVFTDAAVAATLQTIREACGGPEMIDESPETAPSKRILEVAPDYTKTVAGPQAIEAIGLDRIRAACKHADSWLKKLELVAS